MEILLTYIFYMLNFNLISVFFRKISYSYFEFNKLLNYKLEIHSLTLSSIHSPIYKKRDMRKEGGGGNFSFFFKHSKLLLLCSPFQYQNQVFH
jgi:hypothetical protein